MMGWGKWRVAGTPKVKIRTRPRFGVLLFRGKLNYPKQGKEGEPNKKTVGEERLFGVGGNRFAWNQR